MSDMPTPLPLDQFLQPTRQTTYEGQNLLQIAFPLGGIGAGTVCINGIGALQDFSIRNAPSTSAEPDRHLPLDGGFALLHLPKTGLTRLLEGPFPPEKIYNQGLKSQGYNGAGYEGLPRLRNVTFRGEYPFAHVDLSDPDVPLTIAIRAFNPFIPLDDKHSSLPCAILEYTLSNPTKQTIPFQFSYHLTNLAQKGCQTSVHSQVLDGLGVFFENDDPAESSSFGSAALGILDADPQIKACWFRGGWFDAISALWREISSGTFQPKGDTADIAKHERTGGSVLVEDSLAPGQTVTYPVVITWYFPNIVDPRCSDESACDCQRWHPYYTTQWQDAADVLHYVNEQYAYLTSQSEAFHQALFSSSLPAVVLEAVSANLAIIKSPTVLRHEDGGLWAWEGCFSNAGCCPGSCTHVWNYAQAIPHLFPVLERTFREQELLRSINEQGHINFRSAPPGEETTHTYHAASDGQLGGIIKVYRDWQISGDHAWLQSIYPNVKRSMDFCIEQWDPRHRGLVEEPHHNTYDIEFWGPEGMCSSFYIAALTVMSLLARAVDDSSDAGFYEQLARIGAENIDAICFNGNYYQQRVRYEGLRDRSFVELLASFGDHPTEEQQLLLKEGPKYQYGSGVLSDGVLGAWLAWVCGIETPQDHKHIRQHLQSIWQHNFKPSLWQHANTQRPGYAIGEEGGLLLCSWPNGGKPTLPFVYSDEVWTGIEYQVASHMIANGMLAEGLTLVHTLRARYNGHTRNPWNEYECGNYYARAMASYALLPALTGFHYSAVNKTMHLAPQIDIDPLVCFFSTASGWGTFTLDQQKRTLNIDLKVGSLILDTLNLRIDDEELSLHPHTVISHGTIKEIAF
jgi:uncharacterized protein (DUF608 family)